MKAPGAPPIATKRIPSGPGRIWRSWYGADLSDGQAPSGLSGLPAKVLSVAGCLGGQGRGGGQENGREQQGAGSHNVSGQRITLPLTPRICAAALSTTANG